MRQVKQYYIYKGHPAQLVKTYNDAGNLVGYGGIKDLATKGQPIDKKAYDNLVAQLRAARRVAIPKKGR